MTLLRTLWTSLRRVATRFVCLARGHQTVILKDHGRIHVVRCRRCGVYAELDVFRGTVMYETYPKDTP